ncbi:MAG TPA: class I SAM-dependent methyltransferase [Burkholderiaceae bacterium]|nr:class I SAM-dependent methyltransferase [Burkholderiaceae bacterium]
MEARVQRRIQRYGWDLAARVYEPLWQAQLAAAHTRLMQCASVVPGQRVLDIACGTGLIALRAAEAVGPDGAVVGVDLSSRMVDGARRRARARNLSNATFQRMDAERLDLADASFDVAACALGLMFMPDPARALHEMRRVLRPGGRIALAVWGERTRCAWSALFPIVDAEVASDVCPLFFHLGAGDALARLCADARFELVEHHRVVTTMEYADADAACSAAFIGGPVALAWSRFDERVRARVRARYIDAIARWRRGDGYRLPGEFVVVSASVPAFR